MIDYDQKPTTDYEKELVREVNKLQRANSDLRAKIRQQEQTIAQLRQILASLGAEEVIQAETTGYQKPKRGRPTSIDQATRQRIKALKQQGLSYRAIAKLEAVSLSTVSVICNGQ